MLATFVPSRTAVHVDHTPRLPNEARKQITLLLAAGAACLADVIAAWPEKGVSKQNIEGWYARYKLEQEHPSLQQPSRRVTIGADGIVLNVV